MTRPKIAPKTNPPAANSHGFTPMSLSARIMAHPPKIASACYIRRLARLRAALYDPTCGPPIDYPQPCLARRAAPRRAAGGRADDDADALDRLSVRREGRRLRRRYARRH